MSFNVTGKEVAAGIADPTVMFQVVITIIFLFLFIGGFYSLYIIMFSK